MNRLLYSICVTVVLIFGTFARELGTTIDQPAVPDVVAELTKLERVWNDAHIKGDANALDRLWAEDIVVTVQGMPLMSKKESMGMWRSGRMKFDTYDTSGIRVRTYGETAVVTGRLRRVRRMAERMTEDDWFFTKMYVRRDARWQVVSWHASDAPRP